MALIDELTQLRDKTLASLDASHDYYAHTAYLWRLLQQMVREGSDISEDTIRNQVTESRISISELSRLAHEYITVRLASATFQHFVSLFEDFLFGFIGAWLTAYPRSLENKQLDLGTVLDAGDKAEIVAAIVQREVLFLAFKKPSDWFAYLRKRVGLHCPKEDQILQLAEIKASRDALVHNNGIANAAYVEKSGTRARFQDGDALEIPGPYHRESWQLIKQVVSEIGTAGIQKAQK